MFVTVIGWIMLLLCWLFVGGCIRGKCDAGVSNWIALFITFWIFGSTYLILMG